MRSFIQDVIADIQKKKLDISQLTFILPSKRAGLFLRHTLSQSVNETIFSPEIVSIEAFIENLSDLHYANNTELLFEFYSIYLEVTPKNKIEPFDKFLKWGQLLLQDFNEIDRFLIDSKNIFEYLTAIKEVNHWSLQQEQTQYTKNYLSFWSRLKTYYSLYRESLLSKRKAYQGLAYREAVENLEQVIALSPHKKYVFIGFNALSKAEEVIIQELLQQDLALIYWDIDKVFIENDIHDAGLFARQYKTNWTYFRKESFNWVTNSYSENKNIEAIGIPKNIGQVKHIGELLDSIKNKHKTLQNTAVILNDENLLIPLLNSIPQQIDAINITMGLPLKTIPLATLFELLFKIHKVKTDVLYYKDVVNLLSHQFIKPLFNDASKNYADEIIEYIQTNNVIQISVEKLKTLTQQKEKYIEILFESWNDNPNIAIEKCSQIILIIKTFLITEKEKNLLGLEYLYRFNQIFNELKVLNQTYKHIYNINTLFGLYRELLKTETLNFSGEPLEGLQIMGMLESRILDFDTVIISSVNEGILPAGKSNSSFIPFDVKLENELPTYKEKDAIYAYHFYRLLQRAKNVYILYNTEPDVLNGGEKSRFITQLEIEKTHQVKHYVVSPKVVLTETPLRTIRKTPAIIDRLKIIADRGFSPSSLTNYIRNPLDFYYQKILNIKTYNDVEETVAANTLGSIVHETLEELYTPFKNEFLTIDDLKKMKPIIGKTAAFHFNKHYKEGNITKGKNFIIFEIAKRYVFNVINKEIDAVKRGDEIKIIDLEKEIKTTLHIPELNFPVVLQGTVDRIDQCNGVTRIIDYKSGKVTQGEVEIVNWEDITSDYKKFSKSFQVLCYAFMMHAETPFTSPIEAGIISFKNLKDNYFLKFGKKPAPRSKTKDVLITHETLEFFFIELKKLILEICNEDLDFIEKEV